MPETVRIDPAKFTLNELEQLEDIIGKPTSSIFGSPDGVSAKALKAVVYIVKRREDPGFTMEQAGELGMVDLDIAGDEPADPTVAAG